MKIDILHQEHYSRSELLLRSIFGIFYILIPHGFLLFFYGIWSAILQFLTFWVILFTGRFPESWFEYQLELKRWVFRVNARVFNLADDYPAFGLTAEDEHTIYDVPYFENPDRTSVLLRGLFGFFYVLIPHLFLLVFLNIAVTVMAFIAWWAVLFTGRYPFSFFDFILKYLKWNARVDLYMSYMTHIYPPFSLSAEGYEEEVAQMAGFTTVPDPATNEEDETQINEG